MLYIDLKHDKAKNLGGRGLLFFFFWLGVFLIYEKRNQNFSEIAHVLGLYLLSCCLIFLVAIIISVPLELYRYNRNKKKFIKYFHTIDRRLKIELLNGELFELDYKHLRHFPTWKTGQYEFEDMTTGRHFIFTKFIKNADGKTNFKGNDNRWKWVFTDLSEILNWKIAEATTKEKSE